MQTQINEMPLMQARAVRDARLEEMLNMLGDSPRDAQIKSRLERAACREDTDKACNMFVTDYAWFHGWHDGNVVRLASEFKAAVERVAQLERQALEVKR